MTHSEDAANQPRIVTRTAQRYVAIATVASMESLSERASALIPKVMGYVGAAGHAPSGPLFWRYRFIDMSSRLELDVGVPVNDEIAADGDIEVGELPGGRYATVVYVGHPDGLENATRDLLVWAERGGYRFDKTGVDGGGETWGCRIEEYLTDPDEQPDMSQWQTRLAMRLAD